MDNLLLTNIATLAVLVVVIIVALRYRQSARKAFESASTPDEALAELRAEKDLLRAEHAIALRALEIERDALRGRLHEGRIGAAVSDGGRAWLSAQSLPRDPGGPGAGHDRVTSLEDELAETKAKLSAQEAVTQLKVEEIEALQGELQMTAEELSRAQRRAQDRGEAVRRAEERVALMTMEIEASRATQSEGGPPAVDAALQERLADLQRGLDAADARARELEAENTRLRSALASTAADHEHVAGESIEDQLARLRNEVERLRADNARLVRAAGGHAEADRENAALLRERIQDLAAGIVGVAARGDREIEAQVDAAITQQEPSTAAIGAPDPDVPDLATRIRARRVSPD